MGSPTSVCNRDLGDEGLGGVDVGFGDTLAEASDLANLLEEKYLSRLVTIDTNAGRVVATVFLAGETVAEDLTDRLPVLGNEENVSSCDTRSEDISETRVHRSSNTPPSTEPCASKKQVLFAGNSQNTAPTVPVYVEVAPWCYRGVQPRA